MNYAVRFAIIKDAFLNFHRVSREPLESMPIASRLSPLKSIWGTDLAVTTDCQFISVSYNLISSSVATLS